MSETFITPRIAMLTRHDKVRLIAPVLSQEAGIELVLCDSFDTDCLGSFSGERPRFMSQAECALRKAALAADLSGEALGLGSEGSFSAGPFGLGTFNLELLSCINIEAGWVVTGRFYGPSRVQRWTLTSFAALQHALSSVPTGQLLLLKQQQQVFKGLTPAETLTHATPLLTLGEVELSYDLRAHCCPERQLHIRQAAQDLVARLQRCCPRCSTPGFWPDKAIAGLPCEDCAAPSSLTRQHQACCQRCGYTEYYAAEAKYAAAQFCPVCNP
jgi:ribosomal protein S27AE